MATSPVAVMVKALDASALENVAEWSDKPHGAIVKTWITMRDDLVRDSHQDADGQTVGIDEKFVVGGELLDYPGDLAGTPAQIANCRCTPMYGLPSRDTVQAEVDDAEELLDDAEAELIDDEDFYDVESRPMQRDAQGEIIFEREPALLDADGNEWLEVRRHRNPYSTEEWAAVEKYRSKINFSDIQTAAREGRITGDVAALDSAISRTTTGSNLRMYRGGAVPEGVIDNWERGTIVDNAGGYVSTSARRREAVHFSELRARGDNPVPFIAEVEIPKGFTVGMGEERILEYILPRDTVLVVKSVEKVTETKPGGFGEWDIWKVVMQAVRRE